jgi:hypothetical protein
MQAGKQIRGMKRREQERKEYLKFSITQKVTRGIGRIVTINRGGRGFDGTLR